MNVNRVLMVAGVVGAAMIGGVLTYRAGKKASEIVVQQLQQKVNEVETTAAPPGWDYCTEPSYYIRACEAGPYSRRWQGTPGTCPSTFICGAHTANCIGDDGINYAIIDQNAHGGAGFYPKPQDSAGPTTIQKWTDCYINHINMWGPAWPCSTSSIPGGRQTPVLRTLDQLPPSGQKNSFCILYHCTNPGCPTPAGPSPSPTVPGAPTVTPTPTVPPVCPTCAPTCKPGTATSTPTRTKTATRTPTPHIGPPPTPTPTPHIGPAPTKTTTPSFGPHP